MSALAKPAISHEDDELLLSTAEAVVDEFFQQVRGERLRDIPGRSQLRGLLGYAANHPAQRVLEDFIRHQLTRAVRAVKAAEDDRSRVRPKDRVAVIFWQRLEEEIVRGRIFNWVEKGLPNLPERPKARSANTRELRAAFNKARKHREQLRQERFNQAMPLFVRHFVCHYCYRLKQAEIRNPTLVATEEEKSS